MFTCLSSSLPAAGKLGFADVIHQMGHKIRQKWTPNEFEKDNGRAYWKEEIGDLRMIHVHQENTPSHTS